MLFGSLILVLVASLLLLLAKPFAERPTLAAAIALGAAAIAMMLFASSFSQEATLLGMLSSGHLSSLGSALMVMIAALTILGMMANPYKYQSGLSEVYAFVLYTALGGVLMLSANNVLLFYVGLELSSYSTYILVSYYRQHKLSIEAGAKYFVLGALSSAILLYGISLLFAATGGIYYSDISTAIQNTSPVLLYGSMALLLVGFAFKLALAPFHAWTPDAYQGAPTLVAALLSVGPKVAVVIVLGKFMQLFSDDSFLLWQQALMVLAILSMTIGNFQALNQKNLKRLLGYSSIAQLGTLIIGLASGNMQGFAAVLVYAIAYSISNIGAFSSIAALRDSGLKANIEAYRGLGQRQPFAALALTIFLLSLAGMPLLAGFAAKLFVFKSAVDAGLILLAFIAIANTVLSYFYYFRVIIAIWLDQPEDRAEDMVLGLKLHPIALSALSVMAMVVVVLGLWPNALLGFVEKALGGF
ncbi:MAG: NADH-quinone oxidoreductase subunit N [Deinococcales bacterium]